MRSLQFLPHWAVDMLVDRRGDRRDAEWMLPHDSAEARMEPVASLLQHYDVVTSLSMQDAAKLPSPCNEDPQCVQVKPDPTTIPFSPPNKMPVATRGKANK